MSGEVHILTGFDAIVNQDNVRPGVDLKALERQMISGGIVTQGARERDPSEKLNEALSQAAKKLGINFDDVSGKRTKPQGSSSVGSSVGASASSFGNSQGVNRSPMRSVAQSSHQSSHKPSHQPSHQSPYQRPSTPYQPPHDDNGEGDDNGDNYEGNQGEDNEDHENDDSDHGDYRGEATPPDVFARGAYGGGTGGNGNTNSGGGTAAGGSLLTRTLEQERRSHIDSVVGVAGNVDFSLEKEKREDLKCSMLAEIDSLLTSLSMEEVNLERIPTVGMKSTFEEVETTLKILRHKNDQTRCCTFAEEGLMFAAYALEDLFDGKQVWFGRWSPDLTGYHNQMNVKLRRVRYDTGQIVGAIMEDYNIGPGVRIGLEIIPNMFLYSKMRKQQHSQPSLGTEDADIERANANLRNM
jgi:hypothetical protein